MLSEDQMVVLYDVKKYTRVFLSSNQWCTPIHPTCIHLVMDKKHRAQWIEEREKMREKQISLQASTQKSLIETIRDSILNESETIDDIHTRLQDLIQELTNINWDCLLKQREETLSNYLYCKQKECFGCQQIFPYISLYDVHNRIPGNSAVIRHYCVDCLEEVYNSIFPHCVVCDCRYEIQTLTDDSDFCPHCRVEKYCNERRRLKSHLERASQYRVEASLTLKQWLTTLDYFKWTCAYCKGPFKGLEHYIPLSIGGGTSADNCVPSCTKCNTAKKDKAPLEFYSLFPTENLSRISKYLESQRQDVA